MVSGAGKKAVGAGVVLGGIEAGYRIFPETVALEPSVNAVFFTENGAGWVNLTFTPSGEMLEREDGPEAKRRLYFYK
jgi:hypothetical protein